MRVNVDNFRRAETAGMFDQMVAMAGGVNEWFHFRVPTSADAQPAIRMNRDTLYSTAVVDIRDGASVTLPDADGRYMTMMVINEDHYINSVFDRPGTYELTVEDHASTFVNAAVRTFVEPNDADDVAKVNALQDAIVLEAASSEPYSHASYDRSSQAVTREALLALGYGIADTHRTYGSMDDVEPTRHLIGTAMAWGGLPESEAYYYMESDPQPAGRFVFILKDVPVDGFWSVTIYNRHGYLEPNPFDAYSSNSVTSIASEDGTVTLNLAPDGAGLDNHLYVMDGWNYALRLYKPRQAVLDKSWVPPTPQPVT